MTLTLANPFAAFARTALLRTGQVGSAPAPVSTLDKDLFLSAPKTAARVTCLRGCLWITHDNEAADIVISAGETYARQYASRMLVFALEPSSVAVS